MQGIVVACESQEREGKTYYKAYIKVPSEHVGTKTIPCRAACMLEDGVRGEVGLSEFKGEYRPIFKPAAKG
jgi:hypothetical protein